MVHRPRRLVGAAGLLFVLAACSETASAPRMVPSSLARASATTGHVPTVTSIIVDDPAFQIESDGLGPYRSSRTLESEIQSGSTGDWVLDSYTNNDSRTIYLDFGRPVAGSGPNGGTAVAIPSGYYKFHMISKCHLVGNDFLSIAPGQTVQCPLRIGQIYVGTRQYGVTMNAGVTSAGDTWPETNYANVTCNSASGTCSSWTLTPSGTASDGSSANVGALIETVSTTTRGKTTTTLVKQGDFYLSFRINLTNP